MVKGTFKLSNSWTGMHQERDGLFVSEGWGVKEWECRDNDRSS
jgi:hypothetical protein